MLKEPPPDTRHGARNVSKILEFCFLHSFVYLVTPYHLSLHSNFLILSYFSTSLVSVFSAHVYADVDFLGYSLVLCYFLEREERLWKKGTMRDHIRNFVRWTSRGERSCSQSKLKLLVPFFILRPEKPLRSPFWTYKHSKYTNDFLGIWRKFIWRYTVSRTK